MDMNNHRQSACDRCRGQKLRCVGLGNPILDRHNRYVRNQTPCDRCRKAQVECYSTRPISRKRAASNSLSSDSTTGHNPSNYPRPFAGLHSPQSPLTHLDVSSWSEDGDLDIPRMVSYTGVSPLDSLHANAIPDPAGHSDSSQNPFDFAIEDFLSEEPNLSETSGVISDETSYSAPSKKVPSSVLGSAWLKKLAELNDTLLHNRTNRHETGRNNQAKHYTSSTRSGSSVSLSIGKTLRHCQHFLAILQNIQRCATPHTSNNPCQASGSECGLDFPLSGLSSEPAYRDSRSFELLDPPLLFSILACYAHITEEYEHLFSSILESVTRQNPEIPATLIGTSLDGFKLDGNNILQLEFLLYVSSNLLGKIEKILIGSSEGMDGVSRNEGLLSGKMAEYLESLYNHDTNYETGQTTGEREARARVRVLIREIQKVLKTLES
ncbi:hypothetical protein N7466_005826 [Penicillium verhagenii]|uniref:uncharacterized protein n=1 Tax=Penicillium verhagenii TaxID=1562060 RepID=UPI0025458974|nr:uncharacterized protein N7466_005826 [Penicillium verhagenii]KAJ5930333.1 hypothetical protein N7466_005826 [Penicillium verhagenii]